MFLATPYPSPDLRVSHFPQDLGGTFLPFSLDVGHSQVQDPNSSLEYNGGKNSLYILMDRSISCIGRGESVKPKFIELAMNMDKSRVKFGGERGRTW